MSDREADLTPEESARGAELVERALAARSARLAADDEAAELQGFLASCRRTLCAEDERRAPAALAERVLDATTREDLSVRGDLRLLRGWLSDALRGSLLLRVAAASLLLHVFAVPVVAAILFFTNERREPARITFAPPLEDPFLPRDDVNVELELPPDDALFAELEGEALDPLAVSNALRLARWSLTHGGTPAPLPAGEAASARAAADPLERLLALRSEALAARDWSAAAPLPELGTGSGPARVVWLETQLDRFALSGELAPEWTAALATMDFAGASPLADLERAALARAADYGLLDSGQRARWADALTRARADSPRLLPVDAGWLEGLEACLPLGTERGPELDAWLRWSATSEPPR